MSRVAVFFCALLLKVSTAGFAQSRAGDSRKPVNATTLRRLEKDVPELMRKGEVPGLSLALIKDGKKYWVNGFGVRNVETKKPVAEDTIFEAASLSKPVFAYAVLKLADEGKIDLDAPLTRYLPGTYDVKDDSRINEITARFVLSHRTGFRNWRNDEPLKIYFKPGEKFSYSGEGFVYLSKVVEHITGEPFNEFMKKTVFDPLGMSSSSYLWRPDYEDKTATGHNAAGHTREKGKPTEVNAAASLHTTAADYARFMEAVVNGTGLKPATLQAMFTPQVAVDRACTNCTDQKMGELSKEISWGLGVGLEQTASGKAFWHWGDNGVFRCFMIAYPDSKDGLVLFTNSENGLSIARAIVEDALGGEHPAFQWVKYDEYDSPAMLFYTMAKEQGVDAAERKFRAELGQGTISEQSVNSIGYRLLAQDRKQDAIRVFELNVKEHPASWNAYDSLGEAYMTAGNKELAIKNYEKSVELNPKNSGAAAALKKLKGE